MRVIKETIQDIIIRTGVSRGTIYAVRNDTTKIGTEVYYKIMYGEYTDKFAIANNKMKSRLILCDNLREVADEIGVNVSTLIGYKNGVKKTIQFETFLALQCALGVAGRDL